MTDLRDRLDQLAADAMRGATIEHPSQTAQRTSSATRRTLVIAAATLVAVVGAASLWAVFSSRSATRLETVDDGPVTVPELPTLVRPHGPEDQLPPAVVERLREDQPEMDADASWAGPTDGTAQVYAVPTVDGNSICVLLLLDAETSGTSCSPIDWVRSQGSASVSVFSIGSGSYIGGVVADDVISVQIAGERADLDGGLFLGRAPRDGNALDLIELEREPARATLVEACDALAPVARSLDRLDPLTPSDIDTLIAVADGPHSLRAFQALADALVPFQTTGVDPRDGSFPGPVVSDAIDTCQTRLAPWWATVYVLPADRRHSDPRADVDLEAIGQSQELVETDTPSMTATGPGLGPITRFALEGQPVTVYLWDEANPNLLTCYEVRIAANTQAGCLPTLPDIQRIEGTSENGAGEELVVYLWRHDGEAAYATASIDGQTFTQTVRGRVTAFALAPGRATLTLNEAHGAVVDTQGFG